MITFLFTLALVALSLGAISLGLILGRKRPISGGCHFGTNLDPRASVSETGIRETCLCQGTDPHREELDLDAP